jgi:LacI family transcriptional regulator
MSRVKEVTISHVAREAGVSLATVSRVLNNGPSVSSAVRARVLRAVESLKYGKRVEGVRRKDFSIALVVPDLDNPFFALLVKGVLSVARDQGYRMILYDSGNDPRNDVFLLNDALKAGLSGIIYIPSKGSHSHIKQIEECPIPVILADRLIAASLTSYVIADNEEGSYQLTRYLIDLGHRRIAFIAGTWEVSTERDRLCGYRRALEVSGIPYDEELVCEGEYLFQRAYEALLSLMQRGTAFTSIVAANDIMAFGALKALHEKGLRVPEDVSLAGFDNITLSSTVGLTTVDLPAFEMGKNAMFLLIDKMLGRVTELKRIVLKPSLVIRDTCRRI